MSEMENTSDTVARLLQEIEQHVATINCAKVELRGQPDKLGQLIRCMSYSHRNPTCVPTS